MSQVIRRTVWCFIGFVALTVDGHGRVLKMPLDIYSIWWWYIFLLLLLLYRSFRCAVWKLMNRLPDAVVAVKSHPDYGRLCEFIILLPQTHPWELVLWYRITSKWLSGKILSMVEEKKRRKTPSARTAWFRHQTKRHGYDNNDPWKNVVRVDLTTFFVVVLLYIYNSMRCIQ